MKELYPDLCSAVFFLECRNGRGKHFGSSPEQSVAAGAYRGELLGIMAIHLIFQAVNKVNPTLQGRSQIYSDCLGALEKVANIPANQITCQCEQLHAKVRYRQFTIILLRMYEFSH